MNNAPEPMKVVLRRTKRSELGREVVVRHVDVKDRGAVGDILSSLPGAGAAHEVENSGTFAGQLYVRFEKHYQARAAKAYIEELIGSGLRVRS